MPSINDLLKKALSKKTCMKHPVVVVIETLNSEYIIGWNGAPSKGKKHDKCSRAGFPSGEGMELCPTVHAEIKAITHSAKKGIKIEGSTMYMNEWFPCDNCAKAIIEAGIEKFVTPDEIYSNPKTYELVPLLRNQSYNFEMAEKLMREAKIKLVIDPSIR
ncbi:MAG: cytidine deaminase [Nanoarchaeota archaeon]|nr:cytidine deaminase [Nanoarchaeota archaeon]